MELKKTLPLHHGNKKINWIPQDIYNLIKSYIPIPCVDVFIDNPTKGFLWIQRNIPPQLHQWAPVGGRIIKFESPEMACKRIVKKEVGLDIVVKEFLGFSEFRDENHFISLNYRAMLKKHNQEIHLNIDEVSQYLFSFDMPKGTAEQYIDIFKKLRGKKYEK